MISPFSFLFFLFLTGSSFQGAIVSVFVMANRLLTNANGNANVVAVGSQDTLVNTSAAAS